MCTKEASNDRHTLLDRGTNTLRGYLGPNAPLKMTLIYGHEDKKWEVLTQFIPEGVPPILLSRETLDEFPSPTLIAQAMLLAA